MTAPTLEETKLHLRIDNDDEDAAIQSMIDASTAAALDLLDLEELPDAAPVKAAILLQVGDLYENRERQASTAYYRNNTYERLLTPYRRLGV